MATHSSILAWEIPWTEEPGGLESTWSQRVRYSLATKQYHHDVIVQRKDTWAKQWLKGRFPKERIPGQLHTAVSKTLAQLLKLCILTCQNRHIISV